MSNEQIRNKHKNTMKTRPLGQSSLLQFSKEKVCNICGVEESKHNIEICQKEYAN